MGLRRHIKEFPNKEQARFLRVLRKKNAGWHRRWELLGMGVKFNRKRGIYIRAPGYFFGFREDGDLSDILPCENAVVGEACGHLNNGFACNLPPLHSGDHKELHPSGGCVGWIKGSVDDGGKG